MKGSFLLPPIHRTREDPFLEHTVLHFQTKVEFRDGDGALGVEAPSSFSFPRTTLLYCYTGTRGAR